jgi:hypothetical protein
MMQPFNNSTPVVTDENAACDVCGNFGALEIADRLLCSDCVSLAGCGCGGSAAISEND